MSRAKHSTDAARRRRNVALARALQEAREAAGLTATELARKLGAPNPGTDGRVQARERGRQGVGIHVIWATAEALNIPLADIIERAEELYQTRGRLPKGFGT